jgi:hypothetical protein
VLPVELVIRESTGRGPGLCKGVSENDSTVPAATGMVGTKSTNPGDRLDARGDHGEQPSRKISSRPSSSFPPAKEVGLPNTITTTSNFIEHTTTFDDGRIQATFTQTGTFVGRAARGPEPSEIHGSLHDLTGHAGAKVVIAV